MATSSLVETGHLRTLLEDERHFLETITKLPHADADFQNFAHRCDLWMGSFSSSVIASTSPSLRSAALSKIIRPTWHTFEEVITTKSSKHIVYTSKSFLNALESLTIGAASFNGVWFEILGDISRILQVYDQGSSTPWLQEAKKWYCEAETMEPGEGRIQFHLSVVETDPIKRLFHLAKMTISKAPQRMTRNIKYHVTEIRNQLDPKAYETADSSLLGAIVPLMVSQAIDSTDSSFASDSIQYLCETASSHFVEGYPLPTVETICLMIAAVLDFGNPRNPMWKSLHLQSRESNIADNDAEEVGSGYMANDFMPLLGALLLDQLNNNADLVFIHVALANLCGILQKGAFPAKTMESFPWRELIDFLNALFVDVMLDSVSPCSSDRSLPEDRRLHGLRTTAWYYPQDFSTVSSADPGTQPVFEVRHQEIRKTRCLWIGIHMAEVCSTLPE